MEIGRETTLAKELRYGKATVGTTRVPLTMEMDTKCLKGVMVRAPGSQDSNPNSGPVWIGGPKVAASGDSEGWPVPPGHAFVLPVDDPTQLWVIALASNQTLYWIGV